MLNTFDTNKVYTPEQVAKMLQLSKNTVYQLIRSGEIVAKRFGKVYRISATSLSFIFTGLDYDIYKAQLEDEESLKKIYPALRRARKEQWGKQKSS